MAWRRGELSLPACRGTNEVAVLDPRYLATWCLPQRVPPLATRHVPSFQDGGGTAGLPELQWKLLCLSSMAQLPQPLTRGEHATYQGKRQPERFLLAGKEASSCGRSFTPGGGVRKGRKQLSLLALEQWLICWCFLRVLFGGALRPEP